MTLLNNILPEQRRGKLKALLKKGKTVRVLEAHNGLSGIIANNVHVKENLKAYLLFVSSMLFGKAASQTPPQKAIRILK